MEVTFIKNYQTTPSVTSFYFEKPPGFTFIPGQFITLELPIVDCDARCNKRSFSIASSPRDPHLMITTRSGPSVFKKNLYALTKDAKVKIEGPFGRFTLDETDQKHALFLSGGIGITPFHAMIKHLTETDSPKRITVLYSNKTSGDIPFRKELEALDEKNKNLTIHHTFTQSDIHEKNSGRINETKIKTLVPDYLNSQVYIVGPVKMVLELKKLVKSMGVPDIHLKSELFTGY